MSSSSSRGLMVTLIVMMLLSGGCVSNGIGAYFAGRAEGSRPRVGLGQFFVNFESQRHAPEGSISGIIDAGVHKLMKDDSIKVLRWEGEKRRMEMLARVQEVMQSTSLFTYVAPSPDNVYAELADRKKDIAAYARQNQLDLVAMVELWLRARSDSWFGGLNNCYLMQMQVWVFYDAEGNRVGGCHVERKSDVFLGSLEFYDTREPAYAEDFIKLTETAARGCVAELEKEVGKAGATKTAAEPNSAVPVKGGA